MNRLFSVSLMIALLALPAFPQDGGDAGGDGGGLFGGDGGGFFGGGNAGGGNRGGQAQAPDRLVTLKDMLAKANAPLSKDQEKDLNSLLDREIKAMSAAFQAKFGQDPSAAVGGQRGQFQGRGQAPQGGAAGTQPPEGATGRGGGGFRGGGARGGAAPDNPMTAEIRRMNEELLTKVTSSLKPEQQVVIKKFQNDQIRARGGIDALKLVLEEAGAPALTPEQTPQIQALYAEQNQARFQLLRESQGQPDPAKLRELELGTMTKVTRLLTPEQRKALLDSLAKSRQ